MKLIEFIPKDQQVLEAMRKEVSDLLVQVSERAKGHRCAIVLENEEDGLVFVCLNQNPYFLAAASKVMDIQATRCLNMNPLNNKEGK